MNKELRDRIRYAETFLPMFTRLHRRDGRPARAIEAAKAYLRNEIDVRALIRARNAAKDSAIKSTGMAGAAAWAAWRAADEPLRAIEVRETTAQSAGEIAAGLTSLRAKVLCFMASKPDHVIVGHNWHERGACNWLASQGLAVLHDHPDGASQGAKITPFGREVAKHLGVRGEWDDRCPHGTYPVSACERCRC